MNNTRYSKRGRLVTFPNPKKHIPTFHTSPIHITDYIMTQYRPGVCRQYVWSCAAQTHNERLGD